MRTASPPGDSPAMLTPGQKIKAMMAQFDSDSESENEKTSRASRQIARPNFTNNISTTEPAQQQMAENADLEGDEEEDDIIMPRGRIAARLQGQGQEESGASEPETAYDRVKRTLGENDKGTLDDEDDLPMAGPRRRQANRQTNSEDDESDRSPSPARSFSPLFMSSPATQRHAQREGNGSDGSDNEEPQPKKNARLQALIAQKRKEREDRERIEAEKKAARAKQNEQFSSDVISGEDSGDDNDRESAKRLSQQARPSRKASKKALEEMNRETQRMSRNMQLAHQAQTKKKITKESFFARFNFGQPKTDNATGPSAGNSSTTASQNSSDGEAQKDRETPRTSPVMGPVDKPAGYQTADGKGKETETKTIDITMPPLEEVLAGTHLQHEEPEIAQAEIQTEKPQQNTSEPKAQRKTLKNPPVRVQLSRQAVAEHQQEDSDSDLEVVTSPAKCRRVAAFENIKTKRSEESASMLKLKALAHLTSPDRQATSTNFAQLSADLLAQARKQAADERKQRIDELRAQGVFIETVEERQAMEDEIDNLVEKARQEADDIAKQERREKKQGQGDDNDESDEADYEPSGSEDEDQGDDDEVDEEEEDEEETGAQNDENMIDAEADEDEESADEQSEVMSANEADVLPTRRKRPTRVIQDEDDEDEQQHEPQALATPINPITPNKGSAARPEFPGLDDSGGLTMGLTQAFAGTLAGSRQDTQPNTPSVIPSLPDPANVTNGGEQSDSEILVRDSQGQREQTADIFDGYAPSEGGVSESPAPRAMSEFSQVPEPTQDAGFVYSPFDPSKRFRPPPSTIETVVVERNETPDSPVVSKKNKHLRRGRVEDSQRTEEQSKGDFEIDSSAFDVMRKATKKKNIVPFDKQKSKAKDVVEDAAEESEDEYAGLGGASDDSDGEEDAYDQSMINDNSGEVVDEKLLARLNAYVSLSRSENMQC